MATTRVALTLGILTAIVSLGCGGGDEDGGASGGAGGAAGSASGGSAGSSSGGTGTGGVGTSVCPGVKGSCYSSEFSTCSEYGGTQGDETFVTYEQNCMDPNVWATTACSDTGKVGSCKLDTPNGPCNTIVFYEPLTAADSEAECAALQNSEWVP
jgi:hypothetical protein